MNTETTTHQIWPKNGNGCEGVIVASDEAEAIRKAREWAVGGDWGPEDDELILHGEHGEYLTVTI